MGWWDVFGTLRDHQEQKATEDEELNELVMLGPILCDGTPYKVMPP
jgi:hypothetical protein